MGETDDGIVDWEEWNRHLRRVEGWLETARDVVAWRIRCAREGVELSWLEEAEKGRAVIRALTRLRLLTPEATPENLGGVSAWPDVSSGLPEMTQGVELWARVLRLNVDRLLGRGGGVGLRPGTVKAMAIARASYLPSAAVLLGVADAQAALGRWLTAAEWWDAPGNVEARVRSLEAGEDPVRRAARQEGSRNPSLRLSVAEGELRAARKEVDRLKSLVHRLDDVVRKQGREPRVDASGAGRPAVADRAQVRLLRAVRCPARQPRGPWGVRSPGR